MTTAADRVIAILYESNHVGRFVVRVNDWLAFDSPPAQAWRRRSSARRLARDRRLFVLLPPESTSRGLLAADIARRERVA